MSDRFSTRRQCSLCGRIATFQKFGVPEDLLGDDEPAPDVQATRPYYCSVCGGEMYAVEDNEADTFQFEVRELARSDFEIAIYEVDVGEHWALVGPRGSRTATLFAAIGASPSEAAHGARGFSERQASVEKPAVDERPLSEHGLSAQWGVLEGSPMVALRAWKGNHVAFDAIATGTPNECIERIVLRHGKH